MNYKVKSIPFFDRQAKKLSKKYNSFKLDLADLIALLEVNPNQGVELGNSCFKIRVAIKSKGKGKSGGARVITHIISIQEEVYLLTVYDKSDQENISDAELERLLRMIE